MILGRKYLLLPTPEQQQVFFANAGVARFAYNRCKALSDRYYRVFKKGLSAKKLSTYFTKLKKRPSYAWLNEYSADIPKQAVKDFLKARTSSFKRYGNGYHINFKSKLDNTPSFYADYVKTKVRQGKRVYVSMVGDIATSRQLPTTKKLSNPRITFDGVNWFLSVGFQQDCKTQDKPTGDVVGIDLGIKDLMVCSNGMVATNIAKTKPFAKLVRKQKITQRKMSKRYQKGQKQQSKGYYKAKKTYRKITTKITNITKNHIHQVTTALVKTKPKSIVVEDLSIKNMMKNKKLANTLQKSNLGFARICLAYKAKKSNIKLVVADKWFPSSRLCSHCGEKYNNELQGKKWGLHIREWQCVHCSTHHDRDFNASLNLKSLG